eukprot:5739776-Pyramimonas_sp.AAC.1
MRSAAKRRRPHEKGARRGRGPCPTSRPTTWIPSNHSQTQRLTPDSTPSPRGTYIPDEQCC